MPSVNQLKRTIANSSPGDWARWETEWSTVETGESEGLMAVYQPDPRLRLELGLVQAGAVEEDWLEPYSTVTENNRFSVWVMYDASPIDRLDAVAVEGYSAWIPVPHRGRGDGDPWTLSPYENMVGVAMSPDLAEYLSLLEVGGIEVARQR